MERRPLIIIATLILIAFALIQLLRSFGQLESLELAAYDGYLRLAGDRAGPSEPIVMVEYTEEDEAAYGYPLPDDVLAELLETMAAKSPVAIGLDLIRDRPEPQIDDKTAFNRLSTAFQSNPEIVGIFTNGTVAFDPPPALQDRPMQVASATISPDSDGLIRRGLLNLTDDDDQPRPTLAFLLAVRYLVANGIPVERSPADHIMLGGKEIRPFPPDMSGFYRQYMGVDGGYQFLLTFPACASGFERHRVEDVLNDPDRLDLNGRIALIGNTVRAAKDVFDVPTRCADMVGDKMFGIHLHGQIISQLIGQAEATLAPMESSVQRVGHPTISAAIDGGWTWIWTTIGGLTVLLMPSPFWLISGAGLGLAALLGSGALIFVTQSWWLPVVPAALGFALALTFAIAYVMTRATGEREQLMTLFSGVVSKGVADAIWRRRQDPNQALQLMTATVMFSDIKGFTTISESLDEAVLADWLNDYMATMVDIVARHDGVIEKFAGDGLTVEFGVPEPRTTDEEITGDARNAVDCAIAMADRLPFLNAAWSAQGLPEIGIRVGIHTGPLMVGVIGSADRWQYSIIGDTANTAARLESYAKDDPMLGCDVGHCRTLISKATWQHLGDEYEADYVGEASLKGKSQTTGVYRVIGRRAGEPERQTEIER